MRRPISVLCSLLLLCSITSAAYGQQTLEERIFRSNDDWKRVSAALVDMTGNKQPDLLVTVLFKNITALVPNYKVPRLQFSNDADDQSIHVVVRSRDDVIHGIFQRTVVEDATGGTGDEWTLETFAGQPLRPVPPFDLLRSIVRLIGDNTATAAVEFVLALPNGVYPLPTSLGIEGVIEKSLDADTERIALQVNPFGAYAGNHTRVELEQRGHTLWFRGGYVRETEDGTPLHQSETNSVLGRVQEMLEKVMPDNDDIDVTTLFSEPWQQWERIEGRTELQRHIRALMQSR